MVETRRKRAAAADEAPTDPQPETNNNTDDDEEVSVSEYERVRERRIQENLRRMQKLGILNLATKFESELLPTPKRPRPKNPNPPPPSEPARRSPRLKSVETQRKRPAAETQLPSELARRSSRLKSVASVNYSEIDVPTSETQESVEISIPKGTKLEIYTEEHERLLGDCSTHWTRTKDGYGEDGKHIYDSAKGKSCHQCRQKTLGHHTECSRCNSGQGRFCGACLYTRYGENVIEANQNPNWICPVCRGFCNCSFCRQEKGLLPTGNLHRKVLALGFKSLAHYLVKTCRSQTKEENPGDVDILSSESLMHTEDPISSEAGTGWQQRR